MPSPHSSPYRSRSTSSPSSSDRRASSWSSPRARSSGASTSWRSSAVSTVTARKARVGWPHMSRSALVSQSSGQPRRSTTSSSDTKRTRSTSGSPTAAATRPMPAWGIPGGGPLNEQQVEDVVNYLATIQVTQDENLADVEPGISTALDRLANADATVEARHPRPRAGGGSDRVGAGGCRPGGSHWRRRRERPSTEPPPASTPMPTESPMRPRPSSARSPPRRSRRSRSWSRSLSTRRRPTPSWPTTPSLPSSSHPRPTPSSGHTSGPSRPPSRKGQSTRLSGSARPH